MYGTAEIQAVPLSFYFRNTSLHSLQPHSGCFTVATTTALSFAPKVTDISFRRAASALRQREHPGQTAA